jgi:LPXTG-motif cell wall-anchored protein
MPELDYPHAYALIGVCTVLFTLATILYFRKRKWF